MAKLFCGKMKRVSNESNREQSSVSINKTLPCEMPSTMIYHFDAKKGNPTFEVYPWKYIFYLCLDCEKIVKRYTRIRTTLKDFYDKNI